MTDLIHRPPVLPRHLSGGQIASTTELRNRHLAEVLWYVRERGPISRQDVARDCRMSPSTVTELVADLQQRRLVVELPGDSEGRKGRPKRPLVLDGSQWYVMGVHVAADTVATMTMTVGGDDHRCHRDAFVFDPQKPTVGFSRLARILARRADRLPQGTRVVSAGFAMRRTSADPGASDAESRTGSTVPHLLTAALTKAGLPGVHVTVAGEGQCEALHATRSVLRIPQDKTSLYVGGSPHLSGGLIMDGQIVPGRRGVAGEIAHLIVGTTGARLTCSCGQTGCLDTVAGLPALLERCGLTSEAAATVRGTGPDPASAVAALRAEAAAGNRKVLRALDRAGAALNRALSAACTVLDPAAVVIGGHLGALRDHLPPFPGLAQDAATGGPEADAVTYVDLFDDGPVLGAALAAHDASLTRPLTWTGPPTRRVRR